MFKVKPKNNPNITYTVYAVIPISGSYVHFLVFINNEFVMKPARDFIPAE